MSTSDRVAVYGTLRAGGRLHGYLGVAAGRAERVGQGHVAGELFEVPPARRDASVGSSYPCLVAAPRARPGSLVVVECYAVVDPSLWLDLDALEGCDPSHTGDRCSAGRRCEYHRRVVPVMGMPELGSAWVYTWAGPPIDPRVRIASGDWFVR